MGKININKGIWRHTIWKSVQWFLLVLFSSVPNIFAAQSSFNSFLPDCDVVKKINITLDQVLLEENRYQYIQSKDTLSYIYCKALANNNQELKANSLAKLAAYTINNENDEKVFDRFINLLNLSLEISEQNNYSTPLIHNFELLTSTFTANKLYDLATLYAKKFIDVANKANDSLLLAEGYMHLGRILREEKKYGESDAMLKTSLRYLTKGERSNRIGGFTYLHLANLKRLEKKYNESIDFAKKGIDLIQTNFHYKDFQIAALSIELILSNIELGNLENEQWIERLKEGDDVSKWLKGQYSYIQGIIHEKKGDSNQAIDSYLEALRESNKAGSYQSTLDISKKILNLLNKKEISQRAFEVYQITQEATNKIIQQNGSNSLLESSFFKLNNEKYQKNILKQDLKNSKRVIWFSMTIITLFMIISLLVYRQNTKVKKLNAHVNELNVDLVAKNNKLKNSYEEIDNRKNELTIELKQQLLLLANQKNMIQKIRKIINDNRELSRKSKSQILNISNIDRNNEIIDDINLKFVELNDTLLSKLSSEFPNLTSNDLKLCLYLSMNLSSKEIAQIQYKSPQSIKVARSRLRKKLNIHTSSIKLSTFLNGYK